MGGKAKDEMSNGWICLHRELLDKPIWKKSTPHQRLILIVVLLLANHKPNDWEWKGVKFKVESGQFVTSLESIRKQAGEGISTQNVRSALKRFEKLQFLTNKATKSGRLISIINWGDYQSSKGVGQQRSQQRGNKDPTPNNNDNNETKKIIAKEIIEYLNLKTGKKFSDTKFIIARLNEGKTKEQCVAIIDNQSKDDYFIENPKYMNPQTLFRPKNWDKYLNNIYKSKPKKLNRDGSKPF